VHDFFPPAYRGIKRFTEQSLRYATPYRKAKAMVEFINERMPDGCYNLIELFGGIGCNTLAFMECRRVAVKAVVESDAATATRLKANLTTWAGILKCPVPLVVPRCHTAALVEMHTAEPLRPTAYFLDPPWGDEPPYKNPLKYRFHDTTVQEFVYKLLQTESVHLVAVKVPKCMSPDWPLPDGIVFCRFSELKKMDLLCFTRTLK